ncbi:MAG TPA: phospholipase D family protein [Chloroflexota bacterium]
MPDNLISLVHRASSAAFLPVRNVAGPFHRRRPALTEEQEEHEKNRQPLGGQWAGDDRWYAGGFPPRAHNALHPLLHGENYFRDLCDSLRSAQQRVTIAGWCLTPLMSLHRDRHAAGSLLAEVLNEVAQQAEVRILLWSGALALFEPNVHLAEEVRRVLKERAPRVRCELDRRAHFSHDHHQKAVTIDGRLAYVGGMDLSTFQGDRWDTRDHVLRFGPNWHDAQVRLEGEVVRDVEENFCQRWNAVTGESIQPLEGPPLDPAWNTPAQIVRTVPAAFYPFAPQGEYGIRHSILAAIRCAERFVYLENQYIWSPEVVEALCDAMNRRRSSAFRVVLVLPAKAYDGSYDNDRHVQLLRDSDHGRGMFEAYSLYASGPAIGRTGYAYLPIYVHAKVGIIDDSWLSIGSANLNRRGLGTDTEMNVQAVDGAVAKDLRAKLWSEHLGMPEQEVAAADPIELIDGQWKSTAKRLAESMHDLSVPPGGQTLRYEVRKRPTSRVLDMVQDLTLEH